MRFIFLLFFSTFCFAQQQYNGLTKDVKGNFVSRVVITVSKAKTPTKTEQIIISDSLGLFQLQLDNTTKYKFTTKHISYLDTTLLFNTSVKAKIEIILSPANYKLDEIIIKHQKPKIRIRKDTVSFNLSKFINSNDRKLKDIVKKLPGLSVLEDGSIYFKGELITKLLVENEEFFGGGTKLGLDNIPADAIEKLEIIANYSKSKLLKNIRRTDEQVINLVLNKKHKFIIFGNTEGETDFDSFYKLQTSLFQFKRKTQTNAIIEINNIGYQPFGKNEAQAFINVNSELYKLKEIPIEYGYDENEYSKIENKTAITNIKRIKEHSTWDFLSYYNENNNEKQLFETQEYLNNNSFESRDQLQRRATSSLYFRATNYLQTNKKERLFSEVIFFNKTDMISLTESDSNLGIRDFNESDNNKSITLSSLFEETRVLSKKGNIVYGAKIEYTKSNTKFLLKSNQEFLQDFIPWINQNEFKLRKNSVANTFSTQLGGKYFHLLNKWNTLTFSTKFIFNYFNNENNQFQELDNENQNDLGRVFNSKTQYNNFQSRSLISYSYNKARWNINTRLSFNIYSLNIKNLSSKRTKTKGVVNPFINISLSLNNKKKFSFSYIKTIELPSISQLDTFKNINDYTSIIIGNQNLNNTTNHNLTLSYSDYNIPKNYSWYSNNTFNIIEKSFASLYEFNDINNVTSYFLQDNVGFSFSSRNRYFYLFNNWSLGLRTNFSITARNIQLDIIQKTLNNRINISPVFKTDFKNTPNVAFSPYWTFNSQKFNNINRSFISKGFQSKIDYNIFSSIYANLAYNYSEIENKKVFDKLNFEVRYTNNIKSLDLSIVGINIFASKINENIYQSSFFRTVNSTQILGRRLLFKVVYYF